MILIKAFPLDWFSVSLERLTEQLFSSQRSDTENVAFKMKHYFSFWEVVVIMLIPKFIITTKGTFRK